MGKSTLGGQTPQIVQPTRLTHRITRPGLRTSGRSNQPRWVERLEDRVLLAGVCDFDIGPLRLVASSNELPADQPCEPFVQDPSVPRNEWEHKEVWSVRHGNFEIGYRQTAITDAAPPPLVRHTGPLSFDQSTLRAKSGELRAAMHPNTRLFQGPWQIEVDAASSEPVSITGIRDNNVLRNNEYQFFAVIPFTIKRIVLSQTETRIDLEGSLNLPALLGSQKEGKGVRVDLGGISITESGPQAPHSVQINLPEFSFKLSSLLSKLPKPFAERLDKLQFETEGVTAKLDYDQEDQKVLLTVQGKMTAKQSLPECEQKPAPEKCEDLPALEIDFGPDDDKQLQFSWSAGKTLPALEVLKGTVTLQNFEFLSVVSIKEGTLTFDIDLGDPSARKVEFAINEAKLPPGLLLTGGAGFVASAHFPGIELDSFSIFIESKTGGVPIPGTPVLLTGGGFALAGIASGQLADLVLTLNAKATAGPKIPLSKLQTLINLTGLEIDAKDVALLELDAQRDDAGLTLSRSFIKGKTFLDIIHKDILTASVHEELNWSEGFFKASGSVTLLEAIVDGGIASGNGEFTIGFGGPECIADPPTCLKSVTMSVDGRLRLPAKIGEFPVPFFGGSELAGAQARLQFINDDDFSNDFADAWASVSVPLFGNYTIGARVGFDGSATVITSAPDQAPAAQALSLRSLNVWSAAVADPYEHEFEVTDAGMPHLLVADWEMDVGDLSMEITRPDGAIFTVTSAGVQTESGESATDLQLVTQSPFFDSSLRTIAMNQPTVGLWRARLVAAPDSLGAVSFNVLGNTQAPQVTITQLTGGGGADPDGRPDVVNGTPFVEIAFSSNDPDSQAAISLYYDDDNADYNGTLITSGLVENDDVASFQWDTQHVPPGTYYLYAVIDDGNNATAYSDYSTQRAYISGHDDLLASIRQALTTGLRASQTAIEGLDTIGPFAEKLPVVGRSIGDLVSFGDTLQASLIGPALSYLESDDTPTAHGLVDALHAVSFSVDSFVVTVDPIRTTGGFFDTASDRELRFDIAIDVTRRSAPLPLNFGADAQAIGLSVDGSVTLDPVATLSLTLSFGVKLSPLPAPEDSFFLRIQEMNAGVSVHADDLQFNGQLGPLSLAVHHASVDIDATANVQFIGAELSLADLTGTPIHALATIQPPVVEVSAVLPVETEFSLGELNVHLVGAVTLLENDLDFFLLANAEGPLAPGLEVLAPSQVTWSRSAGLEIHARARAFGVLMTLDGNVQPSGDFEVQVSADRFELGDLAVDLVGKMQRQSGDLHYHLEADLAGELVPGFTIEPAAPKELVLDDRTGLTVAAQANIHGVGFVLNGQFQDIKNFSATVMTEPFEIGGASVALTGTIEQTNGQFDWELTGSVSDWSPLPFLTVQELTVTLDPVQIGIETTTTVADVADVHLTGDFCHGDGSFRITADAPSEWEIMDGVQLENVLFAVSNRASAGCSAGGMAGPTLVTASAQLELFNTDFIVAASVTQQGSWIVAQPLSDWSPIPGLTVSDLLVVASTYDFVLDIESVPPAEVATSTSTCDNPLPLEDQERQICGGVNLIASSTLPDSIPEIGGSEVRIAGVIGTSLANMVIRAAVMHAEPWVLSVDGIDVISLDSFGLEITGQPSLAIFAQGRILRTAIPGLLGIDQDIALEAKLGLTPTELSGSMSLVRPVNDILNIDGLNIIEADVSFGVSLPPTVVPVIGLNFLVELPEFAQDALSLPQSLGASLKVSATEPILAMSVVDWRPFEVLGIDDLRVDEGRFAVAPNGGSIGSERFERGFSAAFDMDILGTQVSFAGVFDESTRGVTLRSMVSSTRIAGIDIGGPGCDRRPETTADNGACFSFIYTATDPLKNGLTVDFDIDLPGNGGLTSVHGEFLQTSVQFEAVIAAWQPVPGIVFNGSLAGFHDISALALELDFDVTATILRSSTRFVGSIYSSPSGFELFATATIETALVDLAATIDLGKSSAFSIGLAADFTLPGTRPRDVLLSGRIGTGGVDLAATVENWQLVPGLTFDGSLEIEASLQASHLVVNVDVSTHLLGSRLDLAGTVVAGANDLDLDLTGSISFRGTPVGLARLDLEAHVEVETVGINRVYRLALEGELELFRGFVADVTAEIDGDSSGQWIVSVEGDFSLDIIGIDVGPFSLDLRMDFEGHLQFGSRVSDFEFGLKAEIEAHAEATVAGVHLEETINLGSVSFNLDSSGLKRLIPNGKPEVHRPCKRCPPTGITWKTYKLDVADSTPPEMTVTATCQARARCGTITVTGTSAPEAVRAYRVGSDTIVQAQNTAGEWKQLLQRPTAHVNAIDINMKGGNDWIDLAASGLSTALPPSSRPQSVTSPTVIRGGTGRDVIYGGAAANVIYGGTGGLDETGGRELVLPSLRQPADGSDQLTGGSSNDSIFGEAGNDSIAGAGGSDAIDGGPGANIINGTLFVRGTDRPETFTISRERRQGGALVCGFGPFPPCEYDAIVRSSVGSAPPVTLIRTPIEDLVAIDLDSRGGDDRIVVEPAVTVPAILFGGTGRDSIQGGGGPVTMRGGAGADLLVSGAAVDLLLGEEDNDILVASTVDVVDGGPGTNLIVLDGSLKLHGSDGPDQLQLSRAADNLVVGWTPDTGSLAGTVRIPITTISRIEVNLAGGDDIVNIAAEVTIPIVVDGGPGNDRIRAGGGPSTVRGGEGDDEITGGLANDILLGGPGNDTVTCGAGIDSPDGGAGDDFVQCEDNVAPTLAPIPDRTVDEGTLLSFTATATDPAIASIQALTGNPTPEFVGPLLYLSQSDSPFEGVDWQYFHLENFEDGRLNVPGVSASAGAVHAPGMPAHDRPSGVVGWWRSEGDARDSASGNHGTLHNGVRFAPGIVGQAFSFDGVNDFVSVPHNRSLQTPNALTVEAWIQLTESPDSRFSAQTIAVKGHDAETPLDWAFAITGTFGVPGKLRPHVRLADGQWIFFDCNTTLRPFQTYHVAMTYDGTQASCFLNGIQDGSWPVSGALRTSDGPVRIGAYAPVNGTFSKHFFAGQIDELAIYDRALSGTEIQAIFNATGTEALHEVYRNDFEGRVESEWSNRTTDVTPIGNRRFLGQFGTESVSLSLGQGSSIMANGLPQHEEATISFDLFVIRTWDGNGTGCHGPDQWSLRVDGSPLLQTTFNNPFPGCETTPQAYPDHFPAVHPFQTGAREVNTLGFTFPGVPGSGIIDSVYNLSFTFPHSADAITLDFAGMLSTPGFDESWGLDNVVVSLRPSRTVWSVGADFSTESNPDGEWSHGWSPSYNIDFRLYTHHHRDANGGDSWSYPPIVYLGAPSVYHNGTGRALSLLGRDLLPNQVIFHPGPLGENGVIRWTAPISGRFTVSAVFGGYDNATTSVGVIHNPHHEEPNLLFGSAIEGRDFRQTFVTTIDILAEESIDFIVGDGANTFYFDSTSIDARIMMVSGGVPAPLPVDTPDSVDADDGLIDGDGSTGHSFQHNSATAGIEFTFDARELGGLPTHVGIVWTDGGSPASRGGLEADVTFEAFDAAGQSLGSILATDLGDATRAGGTSEDRFFGVVHWDGISRIRISDNDDGPIEIDHLQIGRAKLPTPPPAQKLIFSIDAGAPAGATIDPETGVFHWTPSELQGPGVYSITVRVRDDGSPSLSDSQVVTVAVGEINLPPVLGEIADRVVAQGDTLRFFAPATDPDRPANRLQFHLEAGAPAGATIDPRSGEFLWNPSAVQHPPGDYAFTIHVSDGGAPNLSDSRTFIVTTVADVTPPTIEAVELVSLSNRGIDSIRLRFSEAIDPVTAAALGNYRLRSVGDDFLFGTADDRDVPIRSAVYNDATETVQLIFDRRQPFGRFIHITAAAAGGLSDPAGNVLDGDFDRVAGGAFVVFAGRALDTTGHGAQLWYVGSNEHRVTLTAMRAAIDILRDARGDAIHVSVSDTRPASELRGTVRTRNNLPGSAPVRLLTGIGVFQNRLPAGFRVSAYSADLVDALLASGEL